MKKKGQGYLLSQLSRQRSYNANIYSGMLIPPGYTSARDTCRAEGLLGPVGLPSCHSASNGTCGYLQYFTGIHIISLLLSSSVLATLWGAAHQEPDRWEVTLTEMKHKMIPGKPSPQIMRAPCADSRCCRGKCRWGYYCQRFCWADGNPGLCCACRQFVFLAAGKLESMKRHYKTDARPDPVSSPFALRWLSPEGCGCQQVWHSSCWLHMVAHRWHLVGTASLGLAHGWAKSWGTAGCKVHTSLLFSCCSDNPTVLQTLGTFAVTDSETSLPKSSLQTLGLEIIPIGKKFQFPREISSTSSWIPI